jgi:tetratricopeptide (TPR) repeat protein
MNSHPWLKNFNSAADAFASGDIAQALEQYVSIFLTEATEISEKAPWIFFETRLRIAFCLIELNEFIDALRELESPQILTLFAEANPSQRYSYFFTYANVLSKLGFFENADLAYREALKLAQGPLQDLSATEKTLRFRMQNSQRFGEWLGLLEIAREAARLAQQHQLPSLAQASREAACLCYRGLLRFSDARKGAELVLQQLHQNQASPAQKDKWIQFINEIQPIG